MHEKFERDLFLYKVDGDYKGQSALREVKINMEIAMAYFLHFLNI